MSFLVHTMEYYGDPVTEELKLRNFNAEDYTEYKLTYEDCFHGMRQSLGLPRECCKSPEELLENSSNIFILEEKEKMIGSVAVCGNEIDDLFVADEYRHKGYGVKLLRFAVSYLQKRNVSSIILRVADINRNAMKMYLENGFIVRSSEEIG